MAQLYEALKGQGRRVEVVYVSDDRGARDFERYTAKHPEWFCLPYGNKGTKRLLDSRYRVEGIPTVVVVDVEGGKMETVTADAAAAIRADPAGLDFPWRPDPWETMLTTPLGGGANAPALVRKDEASGQLVAVGAEQLSGKTVAIYFGGEWCPHCITFKPDIAGCWQAIRKKPSKQKAESFEVRLPARPPARATARPRARAPARVPARLCSLTYSLTFPPPCAAPRAVPAR
jgi:nucleoredoxin